MLELGLPPESLPRLEVLELDQFLEVQRLAQLEVPNYFLDECSRRSDLLELEHFLLVVG